MSRQWRFRRRRKGFRPVRYLAGSRSIAAHNERNQITQIPSVLCLSSGPYWEITSTRGKVRRRRSNRRPGTTRPARSAWVPDRARP